MSKDPKFETNPNDENSKHQMRNRDEFKALKKKILVRTARGLSDCTKLDVNTGLLKLNKEIRSMTLHQPLPASGSFFVLCQGGKVARESLFMFGAKRHSHPGSETDIVQADDSAGQKTSFFGCHS